MTSLTAQNDTGPVARRTRCHLLYCKVRSFVRVGNRHMLQNLPFRSIAVVAMTFLYATVYAQIPSIPTATQRSLERIIGTAGSYAANESVFKIRIPRTDIALNLEGQRAASALPIESWVAFSPEIRGGGLMMGELQLLEEEVNPVASAVLDAGLNITGLANAMIFDQPRLLTMNVSGTGPFDELATGIRKSLDAITAVHASKTSPARSQLSK